jgi:hypothetical protein
LGEVHGVVSGFRVVKGDVVPRVETNFEGKGAFCGQDITEIVRTGPLPGSTARSTAAPTA